jgi:formate hydrogenlyase transcriptional activator
LRLEPGALGIEIEPAQQTNVLETHEREMIESALAEAKGRVAGRNGAAARLRLPPSTLESKIRALKIDKLRYRSSAA